MNFKLNKVIYEINGERENKINKFGNRCEKLVTRSQNESPGPEPNWAEEPEGPHQQKGPGQGLTDPKGPDQRKGLGQGLTSSK